MSNLVTWTGMCEEKKIGDVGMEEETRNEHNGEKQCVVVTSA